MDFMNSYPLLLTAGKVVAGIVGIAAALVALFLLNQVFGAFYRMTIGEWFNNWKFIPKVKTSDPLAFIFGDFRAIKSVAPGEQHVEWMNKLGPVYRYRHMFFVQRVLLADPKALVHVLSPAKAYQYPKPEYTSAFLTAALGQGLVSIEGEAHRRQRKIIAPAFAPGVVKDFYPVIHKHAHLLVKKMHHVADQEIARRAGKIPEDTQITGMTEPDRKFPLKDSNSAIIDTLFWLSRSTLDIIGEVGFSADFDSLERGKDHPLAAAMNTLIGAILDLDLMQAIFLILAEKPGLQWLRHLPSKRNEQLQYSQRVVREHAKAIVDRMRQEILDENAHMGKEGFDDSDVLKPKSLISRMVRANMATGLKPSERMSNEELMGQMTTLIIAGHETTATQNTWALWLLAMHPEVQDRLRMELRDAVAKEKSEMDLLSEEEQAIYEYQPLRDVAALPLLDNVVKETVRMLPSVPSTVRVAMKDDVVPLSRSYKRADGKGTFNSIVIPKGHELFIPLNVIQMSKDIWGEDADKFNPDRWDNLPSSVAGAKMPPGHTFAFLTGPRSCVGKQLAVMETQVILAHLLLNFKFEVVPGWDLVQRQQVVRRAFVDGQKAEGIRMPLIVTPLTP
ncbi:hypothetical protein MVES1_001537 [Malassezia vespertilionis]|uniref:Cytochrome P450 n=1 Tax=Malassezia vespertilionis TaxID=2020962 RepID=A0A2N1JCU5_9BASI|nr:uncharacterized protein MVES1_001537 [Malassezia vespertilionis]PKI84342.1 hypothetical protein MVES_001448 [Malassezia vespertilionis]WFD06195.1 hypothetical protein MVES1_001537 [Malassezia vespertilionis]